MATGNLRTVDLLDYLSDTKETIETFEKIKVDMTEELKDCTKNGKPFDMINLRITDIIGAAETKAFIEGITVGVRLKNLLDSM